MDKRNVPQVVAALLGETGRVTSGDLARALGITRQGAYQHLRKLADRGVIVAVGTRGRGAFYVDPQKADEMARPFNLADIDTSSARVNVLADGSLHITGVRWGRRDVPS